MTEYVIQTTALRKRYGERAAVDDVAMRVPRGQIYGLLGRNGAGKTTLMRLLLGLAAPTGGRIELFGCDHRRERRHLYGRIGSLVEAPGFYENLTGAENLRLLARLRGLSKSDCVRRALTTVGLEAETKKTFGHYSLGMKQRLGIAAAIMHEPELLILDEPINGLDPIGIAVVREYLESLCRERGVTILISSHILSEIEQMADVIGVMHEGRLIEEAPLAALRQSCRQYVDLTVFEPARAARLLAERFGLAAERVADSDCLRLYEGIEQRAAINAALVGQGIAVSGLSHHEEELAEYFSALIGGGRIG